MKIKERIKTECGLLCSIGITSTKASAKIASDYHKPNGLTVVYPYNLTKFLDPLEVGRVAGIGAKKQEWLRELGIDTLGQLAKADFNMLVKNFGANGRWMWMVANGKDEDLVMPRGNRISISSENTLNIHSRNKVKIHGAIEDLIDRILERAQAHDYLFRTVGVKLVRSDFTIETREISHLNFQNTRESISSVTGILVDRFSYSEDKEAIRKVGLKLSHLIRGNEYRKIKKIQKTIPEYF